MITAIDIKTKNHQILWKVGDIEKFKRFTPVIKAGIYAAMSEKKTIVQNNIVFTPKWS